MNIWHALPFFAISSFGTVNLATFFILAYALDANLSLWACNPCAFVDAFAQFMAFFP